MLHLFRSCFSVVATVLAAFAASAVAQVDSIQGDLQWPAEWIVYAPFDRDDVLADGEVLGSIPDVIRTVTRSQDAQLDGRIRQAGLRRIAVDPGMPVDLSNFFERQQVGNTAYVLLELESDRDQVVTLGMGADWWLEAWLNGEPIYDTLANGNITSSIGMSNHTLDVPFVKGTNILAIRLIGGRAGATLAVGGPREFAVEEERLAEVARERGLNILPADFYDRLLYPVDQQATVMAERGLVLPETDADLAAGALVGVQPMPRRQLMYNQRGNTVDTVKRRFDEPVHILLSKYRYPAEDGHLDAIVWTTPKDESKRATGYLDVYLRDAAGDVLARHRIEPVSPTGVFFSLGLPPQLQGERAALEVVWIEGGREAGRGEQTFYVNEPTAVATSGRVPLWILNQTEATVDHAPMTVGVPFPLGALRDEANVRLVDENGVEQPLQTRVTAKWSRYGPIKWLLCDFTAELQGEPRQWYLEYGPEVERRVVPEIVVATVDAGFPGVNAGRLRIADGVVAYDVEGDGRFQPVLSLAALTGAFVQHDNGNLFLTPQDVTHSIEEIGSEKILVRRTGWYVDPPTGERFCQFVTRLAIHRDSPVMRIFHTWIYTGDSNVDRIADMGWRFETATAPQDFSILTAFDDGEWLETPSLVQFDYQQFLLPESGGEFEGRTPGVASMIVGDSRLTFGTKDFWQNFPNEIAGYDDGFAFYNWPKRNPPARFESPVAIRDAFRHRYAHEGEVLDFRMPDEYASGPIWDEATARGRRGETHWAEGRPDSVNAQGVARTEEMFLYFSPADVSRGAAARVIRGLNDESLRAVVDPVWMTASGVFGPIHPKDTERFPDEETIYEISSLAPTTWVERLGVYGKWLYGDYPTWTINLSGQWVSNYRTFRKNHHGFPLRWIAFIRSGDPRFLKLAENAARQMCDANFCHFATADVDAIVGPDYYRMQGWWDRNLFPWAGRDGPRTRGYAVDSDYLWDTYYITGYGRPRDVALLFGELTQRDPITVTGRRQSQSMLKSYLDMYQATFNPWFLDAAHEIAKLHADQYGGELEISAESADHPRESVGFDHWRFADQAFLAFTGMDDYRRVALAGAIAYSDPRFITVRAGASADGGGGGRHSVHAWHLTGDPYHLRRAAATLDYLRYTGWEGDIDYFRGIPHGGHGGAPNGIHYSVPMVMAVLAELDEIPDPVHNPIHIRPTRVVEDPAGGESIHHFPEVKILHTGEVPFRVSIDARGGGVTQRPMQYAILNAEGEEVFALETVSSEDRTLDLPPGVYTVRVMGDLNLFLPFVRPDVPEVMVFDSTDQGTRAIGGTLGYWFFVPEGVEQFEITFPSRSGPRQPINRASVWGPDNQRAWDLSYHNDDVPVSAIITVPPGQDGKLWRATGGNFIVDPQIPPVFSISRTKWFNPDE